MALNIRNMRKWVRALRSGEYKQATGSLKNGYGFCCLGVACDVSKTGRWRNNYYDPDNTMFIGGHDVLPTSVTDWLGIRASNPRLRWGHARLDAAEINDDGDATFAQIADAIERTWPQIRTKKAADRAKTPKKEVAKP